MSGKYLVVDKCILPAYCEKVAEARRLLDEGTAKDISEAVKIVGISRSTYYKYRNFVKEMSSVAYMKADSRGRSSVCCAQGNLELQL